MQAFNLHTADTATNSAASVLNAVEGQLGFIPHLFSVLAESEPALLAFAEMNRLFSDSSFTTVEREVIQLTVSVQNQCGYCVAGHSAFAAMQELPAEVVNAVRESRSLKDPRLHALTQFVQLLVKSQGPIRRDDVERFIQSGFTRAQAIEVVLGIALKTFSNLTSALTDIKLDDQFERFKWAPSSTWIGDC